MIRKVHFYVEGPTEETFVREVLRPYFAQIDVYANPIVATTKVMLAGSNFRGGIPKYSTVRSDLLRLLNDSTAVAVTTMIDMYGRPDDFPSIGNISCHDCNELVVRMEEAFAANIDHCRFVPYFQLHEYEAFAFVDPEETAAVFNKEGSAFFVRRERQAFRTPEEINLSPQTAPSKRIKNIFTEYDKTFHGPTIARRVGLETLRNECPHFNNWLTTLERMVSMVEVNG